MTLEEAMIEHCAPTLAGVKSAGLFRFSPQEPGRFARQFREWRGALDRRGLNLLVLKRCRRTGAYLLYIYRESVLSRELAAPQVRTYLAELGYHAGGECRALLRQLAGRLDDAFTAQLSALTADERMDVQADMDVLDSLLQEGWQ